MENHAIEALEELRAGLDARATAGCRRDPVCLAAVRRRGGSYACEVGVRTGVNARVARQLRHPGGLAGQLVGAMQDRRHRRTIAGAVYGLTPQPGTVVADIGFGGGVGLRLLLDRVGAAGQVHGIEISRAMLNRAARPRARGGAARRRCHHDQHPLLHR